HGEDVDVRGREAAHIQAGCQRLMWKAGAVLDAAKPLLFNGRHEAPLDDQRGRDVAVICVESDDVHARSPAVAGSMTPSRIPGRSMGWSASRNRSLKWRCSKRPATLAAAAAPIVRCRSEENRSTSAATRAALSCGSTMSPVSPCSM